MSELHFSTRDFVVFATAVSLGTCITASIAAAAVTVVVQRLLNKEHRFTPKSLHPATIAPRHWSDTARQSQYDPNLEEIPARAEKVSPTSPATSAPEAGAVKRRLYAPDRLTEQSEGARERNGRGEGEGSEKGNDGDFVDTSHVLTAGERSEECVGGANKGALQNSPVRHKADPFDPRPRKGWVTGPMFTLTGTGTGSGIPWACDVISLLCLFIAVGTTSGSLRVHVCDVLLSVLIIWYVGTRNCYPRRREDDVIHAFVHHK